MTFQTNPRVEWSVDHESNEPQLSQSEVRNPDDFERLLDQLSAIAAATQPFIAELVTSAGARLGIGLGRQGSVLSFTRSDDPPYYMSLGIPEGPAEEVGFYFQGHWSEFPRTAVVGAERAREAARLFVSTGQRPDVVDWQEV